MFNKPPKPPAKQCLGKLLDEKFADGWSVSRSDMRENSASCEWVSRFCYDGTGCTSIDLMLERSGKDRTITVLIEAQEEDKKRFLAAFQTHRYSVCSDFPKHLSVMAIQTSNADKRIASIVKIINQVNAEISSEQPTILPNAIVEEAKFLVNSVLPNAKIIHDNWASHRKF